MAKLGPPQDVTIPAEPDAPARTPSMKESETLASASSPPAPPPTLPVTLPPEPAAVAAPNLEPTLATGPAPAVARPNLSETLPEGAQQGKGWHADSATA